MVVKQIVMWLLLVMSGLRDNHHDRQLTDAVEFLLCSDRVDLSSTSSWQYAAHY